ncbi:MAG: ATP-binding cassette domain-containing protein [Cyclobacteriaceae bacterium]
MNKLEIDSVELAYGSRSILKDIYLSCQTAEIVGLTGRNGSGKSSLMKVIFGSLKGDSQSVRINGEYVNRLFEINEAVHYMPQDGFCMQYLSFDQLTKLFDVRERLELLLSHKEIANNRKTKLRDLSTGMRKFIEVMIIINAKAKFCILDEPFSFLSPVMSEVIMNTIREISPHKGFLVTDHMFDNIWRLCTKHYLLYSGSLRQITDPSQLEDYGYTIN